MALPQLPDSQEYNCTQTKRLYVRLEPRPLSLVYSLLLPSFLYPVDL